jgi:translation initiation factor IF-1
MNINEDKVILDGMIKECLRGTEFLVEIDINGLKKDIVGYVSGKMRKHYIKVGYGDKVKLELSKYDLKRGRIIKRI